MDVPELDQPAQCVARQLAEQTALRRRQYRRLADCPPSHVAHRFVARPLPGLLPGVGPLHLHRGFRQPVAAAQGGYRLPAAAETALTDPPPAHV